MRIYDELSHNYRMHVKSRTQKHAMYPDRFYVPDAKVPWQLPFPDYKPVEFNAPVVLDRNTPWADPPDISLIHRPLTSFEGAILFSKEGIPLNPFGRTGIKGRGVLGKWGANFAADAVITTIHPQTHLFRVLAISRKDTGESAFPGGMVDPGEDVFQTRNRELLEELSFNISLVNPVYDEVIFKGYVDDPRNTDNAWLETTAIHTHIDFSVAESLELEAGDDAVGFRWTDVTAESIRNFYASHGLYLLRAMKVFVERRGAVIDKEAQAIFSSMHR